MKDEFAHSRLPDLPTAGYATKRQRELTDAIMLFIRGIERDRLMLLSIVLDGRAKWRQVIGRKWTHLQTAFDTDLKDAIFNYLLLLAGPNPEAQRDALLRMGQNELQGSSLKLPNSSDFGLAPNLTLKSWRKH